MDAPSQDSMNIIDCHCHIASQEHTPRSFIDGAIRPNVYLDISGYQSTLGYDPAASAVRRIVSLGINHKVLFGTDFPVFRLQGEQTEFLEVLTAEAGALAQLNDWEKSLVLSRNAERLLERSVAIPA